MKANDSQVWKGRRGRGEPGRKGRTRRDWHPDDDAPVSDGRGKRVVLRSAAAATMLAIVIALVLQLQGCCETTVVVADPPETAEDRLPNAFDQRDANAVAALSGDASRDETQNTEKTWEDFQKRLRSARRDDPLLVYFTARALPAGPETERLHDPVLLTSDATVRAPKRLSDLWAALAEAPSTSPKIVLLDLSRIEYDLRAGQLENDAVFDVARGIDAAREKIDNLYVVTSCSEGERSWTSRELDGGRSAFGYFVNRALVDDRANADENGDRAVSVGELYRFVKDNTRHWVILHRDPAGQHPRLFTPPGAKPDEIEICRLRGSGSAPETESAAATEPAADDEKSVGRQLEAAWRRAGEVLDWGRPVATDGGELAPPAAHSNPLLWRGVEFRLLQAERHHRAGRDEVARALLREADDELARAARFDPVAELDGHPFPQAAVAKRLGHATVLASTAPPLPEAQLQRVAEAFFERRARDPDAAVTGLVDHRKEAERLAAVPLGSLPHVEPMLVEADDRRRRHEDLVFAASFPESNSQPGEFDQDPYEEVQRLAREVDLARRTVDALTDQLPSLARWLAYRSRGYDADPHARWDGTGRPKILAAYEEGIDATTAEWPPSGVRGRLDNLRGESAGEAIEADVLLLFHDASELIALLERRPADVDSYSADLHRRTQSALARLADVHDTLGQRVDEVVEARGVNDQATQWRALDDLLACTLHPPATRRRLWDSWLDVGRRLAEQGHDIERAGTEAGDSNSESERRQRLVVARERALWRGLLGIHVLLLPRGPDQEKERNLVVDWQEAAEDLLRRDDVELAESKVDAERVGARIREAWTKAATAAGSPLPTELATREDVRRALWSRERQARCVHGSDARQLLGKPAVQPGTSLRRFLLAETLLRHGDRYLEDFLAATGRSETDWYDGAATACFDAAAALTEGTRELAAEEVLARWGDELRQRLETRRAHELALQPSTTFVEANRGTTEQADFDVASRDVPAGTATVWATLRSPHVSVGAMLHGAEASGGRVVVPLQPAEAEGECATAPLRADLFYRGHFAGEHQAVTVDPCPREGPVRIYEPPPRDGGAVLVRGDDRRDIVFVVDCSYSMTAGGKDAIVRKLLWNAIQDLQQVTPLPRIVLMRYGWNIFNRKPRANVAVPGGMHPLFDVDVFDPANGGKWRWTDRQASSVVRVRPHALDNAFVDQLQRIVVGNRDNELSPFGNTPLLRSIEMAVDQLEDARGVASGVVVVITDGESKERTEQGHYETRLQNIVDRLNDDDRNVEVIVAGFDVPDEDKKSLRQMSQETEGKVVYLDTPAQNDLARELRRIRPREYVVTSGSSAGDESKPLGEPVVALDPADYRVSFPKRDAVVAPVRGGDLVVFDLQGERLEHVQYPPDVPEDVRRRLPYWNPLCEALLDERSKSDFGLRWARRFGDPVGEDRGPASGAPRLPTRLLCQRVVRNDGELSLVLSLDREDDRSTAVRAPAEVWFDVQPAAGELEPATRTVQRSVPGQSVPTWEVEVSPWPGRATAVVQAYWKDGRTEPDRTSSRRLRELLAGEDERISLPGLPVDVQLTAQRLGDDDVEVSLTIPADTPVAEADRAGVNRFLERLRVDLGHLAADGFEHEDVSARTEVVPDRGVSVRFQLPRTPGWEDLAVGLTTRTSLEKGARRLRDGAPLEVPL